MFQSFDSTADPAQGVERVAALRAELERRGLDGFLVPRADEHQGEYVARRSERMAWLTGFTGSAGAALVLAERALLFVDGRYTLQARAQADGGTFAIESLVDSPPARWLGENAADGARIGFDPWLHTIGEARALRKALEKRGAVLVAVEGNPVDAVWLDQPEPPLAPVVIHPASLAGELAAAKLERMAAAVAEAGADCAVLTDPASLAWAFNIRGGDVAHTPLALGFALVAAQGLPSIYLDPRKLGIEERAYLTQLADLHGPADLEVDLAARAAGGGRIALDPALAAEKLGLLVEAAGGKVVEAADPARLPRATKNAAELAGTRAAHRRDGAAMSKFLAWLDAQEPGTQDEISVATKLEQVRRQTGEETQMPLAEISFDTISGAGPNGAIIHYRVTLVLKGLIGISMLRFPAGTRGMDIDAVARMALWKAGFDYAHGTGHGVGSYLSVHEGPQRIAKTGAEKLLAGMILSNEPGYYKEGAYGIRLENLIVVTSTAAIEGGDIAMHGFETLTLAPFDRRLIEAEMLTGEERGWLDAYHARVLAEIGPMLDGATLGWLEAACAPL